MDPGKIKFNSVEFHAIKANLWYIISPFTDNTHRVKNVKRRNLYMKATGIVRRIEEYGIIGQKSKKPHKH